ncbi:MAG: ABC transporter permease, partial [Bacteroidota bacterium]
MASFVHLLHLEWLKLKQHRGFRVLVLMYLVLLPTLILIGKRLPDLPPPLVSAEAIYQFPGIFVYLGYEGNWLCFFLMGFLGVLFVTQEYSYKTLRQNIITGLSRRDYFLSKLYFMLTICLLATLYYTIVAFGYGLTHTPDLFASV